MSPDTMPWWWPVLALLLWLLLLAAHRRERHAVADDHSCGAVHGVLAKSREDCGLDHHVQQAKRDRRAEYPAEDGEEESFDIHARIVACQCLNRAEIMAGIECEHSR